LCSDVIEDSNSAVPVVKLDSEYVPYVPMHQPDVNSRCAVTAAATADTPDTTETVPDSHVIGSYERIRVY